MDSKTDMNKLTDDLYEAQGLPENITTESQLWDEIFKKEIFLMPEQLFPLIREIYGITYEKTASVKSLSTEYPITRAKTQKYASIRSDISFQIGSHDIFHFECESKKDKKIVLRMFEYDTCIALSYHFSPFSLHYPRSALICLVPQKNSPKFLTCKLYFKKHDVYPYKIPVLNVHTYSFAEIKEKHLCILIPFLPIRFRKSLQSQNREPKNIKKELTSFYQEIILILDEEVKNNYLNEYGRHIILQSLHKALIRVFYQNKYLLKEVLTMTEPILKLESDEYFYAIKEKNDKLAKMQHKLDRKDNELARKNKEIILLKKQIARLQKSN